jgi:hypothetical protein
MRQLGGGPPNNLPHVQGVCRQGYRHNTDCRDHQRSGREWSDREFGAPGRQPQRRQCRSRARNHCQTASNYEGGDAFGGKGRLGDPQLMAAMRAREAPIRRTLPACVCSGLNRLRFRRAAQPSQHIYTAFEFVHGRAVEKRQPTRFSLCEPYLTCDAHAPLFWESEPSPTFAHTPLPSNSIATLSPNSSLQVTFICDAPWLDSQAPTPGSVPCRGPFYCRLLPQQEVVMAGYVDFAALTPHLRLRLVHGGACRMRRICSRNLAAPRHRARIC